MHWQNTSARYGIVTKTLHWVVFVLFANQYLSALLMTSIGRDERVLGFSQGALYNWHKSVGIMLLVIVLARCAWRRLTPLPDWAPGLAPYEQRFIHSIERLLYLGMLLMPISGYLFVMAGGYGILLFGYWPLPDFIGEHRWLAWTSQLVHRVAAYVVVATLTLHVAVVLKHQLVDRDGLLWRMLP